MAFIGNVPAESYITTVKDTFSGNGSTTAFTLSQPTLTNDVRVVVENVVQEPTTAYSVAGTTLTFTSAPPSGSNNVYVIHLGPAVQTTVPPETFGVGSIYGASDTDTAITFEGSGVTTFDQNGTEAARFTASGDLLVNKTSSSFGTEGIEVQSDRLWVTRDGGGAVDFNRLTSDGPIAQFYKDSSAVGSIGIQGKLTLGGTASGDPQLRFGQTSSIPTIQPADNSGTLTDNSVNIGQSGYRFKDLYLSGGVYVGGTGSANYLDDYEEGEWTPTDGSGNGLSFTLNNDNWYVKVGNLVTISFDFTFPSTSSTDGARINLPFTMDANNRSGGVINWSTTGSNDQMHAFPNDMTFTYNGNSGRTNAEYSGDRIIGTFTYQTT